MVDYKLVEKYRGHNIFIGDVITPLEFKKEQGGIKQ